MNLKHEFSLYFCSFLKMSLLIVFNFLVSGKSVIEIFCQTIALNILTCVLSDILIPDLQSSNDPLCWDEVIEDTRV